MKRNKRKGATLAEMCIVMAVVAIVSLSVTSFATMASGRGTAAATKLDAMGDLEIVEAVVESWILEAAKEPENIAEIKTGEGGISIMLRNPNTTASAMFSDRTLNVTFHRESGAAFYRLKSIKNIAFKIEQNSDKTATLY
jgi:Tfp pilus assembly protein FimT